MPFQLSFRVTAAAIATVLAVANAGAQTPFRHSGIDGRHPGSSVLPNEQVDPSSGTLAVVETDLALPGNAGFDLRVQRVYNSNVFPDYSEGSTEFEEDSWAGIGWKLHFGRILNPDSTEPGATAIEMGDGSRHPLYHTLPAGGWTTTDFWLYDRATHTLKLPNGVVYVFDREVFINNRLGTARYVTEIRDAFNNHVTFTYFDANGPPDGIAQIRQYLSPTQVREINFSYDPTLKALASMSYLGHTWTYDHEPAGPAGYSVLRAAHPPMGPPSQYTYNSGLIGELTTLTTPSGGSTTYTYTDAVRRASTLSTLTRVVASRTTGGPDIAPGTWTYSYGTGPNQDTTVVTCPCGTTRYRFYGVGLSGDFTAWSAGTLAEQTLEDGATVIERRTFDWARSEPLSGDPVSGTNGIWADDAVYKPLINRTTVTRGSQTFTTNFGYHTSLGNYNDYGRPWFIEEIGETSYQRRTTRRTFQYGFTPYIVDRVVSELIDSNTNGQHGGWRTNAWSYDPATGFLLSEQVAGRTASYEATPEGNIATTIDGRGNRTTFAYSWGVPTEVHTPHLVSTSTVTPEGLVLSATTGVLTTSYEYDSVFRTTIVRPPGGNPVSYTYDNAAARFVRVSRGSAFTQTNLDGFGRPVNETNSLNLKTRVERDACGRVTFASAPYTNGSGARGTRYLYDVLGRPTQVTDAANAITRYIYAGIDVVVTDAQNRSTIYDYLAFSGPGSERLVGLRDASGVLTSYEYDTSGALTKVTGPLANVSRTWVRNDAGLPTSETQPESGTTTYTYDAAFNLISATDANSQTTTYTYDGNNRLTARDAPGTIDDLAVIYDTTGRVTTLSGGGTTTSTAYDDAGRTQRRTDTVGGLAFASTYGYDANDNLTQITYPSGRVVTYEYDTESRLTAVRQNGALFAQSFTYDDSSRPTGYTTGAVTHTFTFDEVDRTSRILATGSGGSLDLTYTYDSVGNVRTIADPRPGSTQHFDVDVLNRLKTADGPWGHLEWTYDAAGNRTAESGTRPTIYYNYDFAKQRLTSTTGAAAESFGYDNVGRLTSDGRGTYTYSPLGRLATATSSGVDAAYAYDAAGTRLSKTVNGYTSYTVRSATGDVLSEYSAPCASPAWSKDVIYAGGRALGAVKATAPNPIVSVAATTLSAGEAAGTITAGFRLTTPNGAPLACAVTAAYHTTSGTAATTADFGERSGTVTFVAGTPTGSNQSITVPIVSDTVHENDEVFTVDLSSATGGIVGTDSRTSVTIVDDDPLPGLTLSVADASAQEGASGVSTMLFTVTLSSTSSNTVQANYATTNDIAIAGADYAAASGVVTIPAGSLSATIPVEIFGDLAYEPNERFFLTLSAPVNATLGRAQASGIIVNDDEARHTWGDFVAPLDGAADAALFDPSTHLWIFRDSNTGAVSSYGPWGDMTTYHDVFVPGDYDGDGRTDYAMYRPEDGTWYIKPASGAPSYSIYWGYWGSAGMVAVPGDYNGDGLTDIALYDRSIAWWHIRDSATGNYLPKAWGWEGDTAVPVPGDYDGDHVTDVAFYWPLNGFWYIVASSTGQAYSVEWGNAGGPAVPVPGDYDGDGKTDVAYYWPPTGWWWIVSSATGQGYPVDWGFAGMSVTPVQADYDGDGRTDAAFYYPTDQTFYIVRSSTGVARYIWMGDIAPANAIPVLKRPQ